MVDDSDGYGWESSFWVPIGTLQLMEHYGTPSDTTTPSRAAGMPRSAPVRAGANETPIGPGRHWLHLMLAVSTGGV